MWLRAVSDCGEGLLILVDRFVSKPLSPVASPGYNVSAWIADVRRHTAGRQGASPRGPALGAQARGRDQDPDAKGLNDSGAGPKHSKGNSFEKADRRRGRPAWLRSPDDSPLRDANRDFMLGVLTAR